MDLAHLRLPYGLETEVQSDPYGAVMGIQQLSRSLDPGFGFQSSTLDQAPSASLPAEQQPWPQRVLGEVQDLILLLTLDGRVSYASPSCRSVTGFEQAQLEHNHFSRFVHDDDKPVFARALRDNDGDQRQLCHGIFLVCRPYNSHSTRLLDSFLEHKMENIRLKERIAQLKTEEEDDLNAAARQSKLWHVPSSAAHRPMPQTSQICSQPKTGPTTLPPSQDVLMLSGEDNESSDTLGNVDDLDQALNRVATIAQSEEDISHIYGIELLTRLNYGEGERSQGISTGIRQNRLFHAISNPPTSEPAPAMAETEPRKRLKGEYRCVACGTSDSPEWRKGPDGPKTMCNACGLRWAKREKKRQN
ncbi:GATA transcription factor LreB [Aspergillus lucknowensis]|uniref:Uncharacterized protein n=1 Tax=Aspergillus lucknowensis TaxID=176173 RepID=A0ABR4L864_9EURO